MEIYYEETPIEATSKYKLQITFTDGNGFSSLARVNTEAEAKKFVKKYKKDLKMGRLLKEHTSYDK